jgi:hypothetical protein
MLLLLLLLLLLLYYSNVVVAAAATACKFDSDFLASSRLLLLPMSVLVCVEGRVYYFI